MQPFKNRSGYTLLEMLVVITVIVILIGLSFGVMTGITQQARSEATKSTISKINRLLEQRLEGFERAFKGARRDSYVRATIQLLSSTDARFDHYRIHPEESPAALIMLARKAAVRYEFPQRMAELLVNGGGDENGNLLPDAIEDTIATPAARGQLIMDQNVVPPTLPTEPTSVAIQSLVDSRWAIHVANRNSGIDKTESSELLYFILFASGTFGASQVDADRFSISEIADTDLDGLPEFVDAWGEPLRYYRWPTRMVDPTAPVFDIPPFDTDNNGRIDASELATAETNGTYYPLFSNPNDVSETRSVTGDERLYASLHLKGLPPIPVSINTSTPRDLLLVDPDDPMGLLATFLEDPTYRVMGIATMNEFNESKYHTPDTYHAPLIVSSGPDRALGIREPYDTNAASGIYGNLAQYAKTFAPGYGTGPVPPADVVDQLFDNITSRNRSAGGNR